MKNLKQEIGLRIASLREQHHLTQSQLAEVLNISLKHCSCVERGVSMLSIDKLIICADYFDVSLDYLLRGISEPFVSKTFHEYYTSANPIEQQVFRKYLELFAEIRNIE